MTPDDRNPDEPLYHRVDDHSLVGPYVLDALEDGELAQFEQHLRSCARCQLEVAELREALVGVSSTVAVAPPPALRASVLEAIAGVAQETPTSTDRTPGLRAVPAPADGGRDDWTARRADEAYDSGASAAAPTGDQPVDELAARRNRRLTRVLTLAVAAVTVVALALGGWVYSLNQDQRSQIAADQQRQAAAEAERQREINLLAAPDAQVKIQTVGDARYSFVISRSRSEALFVGTGLPDPGADRRYQLWTVNQTSPLVDNAVTGSGSVRQWFRGPIDESAALAINIEPASGPPNANTPSGAIIATANV